MIPAHDAVAADAETAKGGRAIYDTHLGAPTENERAGLVYHLSSSPVANGPMRHQPTDPCQSIIWC